MGNVADWPIECDAILLQYVVPISLNLSPNLGLRQADVSRALLL